MRRREFAIRVFTAVMNTVLDILFLIPATIGIGTRVANALGNSIHGNVDRGLKLRGWHLTVESGGRIGRNVRVEATTAVVVKAGAAIPADSWISTSRAIGEYQWHIPALFAGVPGDGARQS